MQSNEPYIGSVRFFKNIIFLCCILGVLIPTGLALRWRSRAKTAESLLAQNAVVLTGEEDEAASEAEAASVETEPEADSSDEQEPLSSPAALPGFLCALPPCPDIEDAGKTIYLTFDDGPSDRTDEVLKILDEKGVKATFFVIGREDETSTSASKRPLRQATPSGCTATATTTKRSIPRWRISSMTSISCSSSSGMRQA